ncbi:hypothetical protein AB0878_36855 [Amycolatopsis sp. NPDC047767]|uniref:hypothetical protein n=1 Tax=Amycolatopsis sp. NPDC047767 TaxID=3156765 RepID=UPI003453608D
MEYPYVANPAPNRQGKDYGVYNLDEHQFVQTGLTPDEAQQHADERNEAARKHA